MIDLFKFYVVLVCEHFGWLTIVDERTVSHYLGSRKSVSTRETSLRSKAPFGAYRLKVRSRSPVKQRFVRCLATLLISMTAGAIVLMVLGDYPPIKRPFRLSSVLDPIQKVLQTDTLQVPDRWNGVEIYFSGTMSGNVEQLAAIAGLASSNDLNCHFVVCNGLGGADGEIQATKKWRSQWSAVPCKTWLGSPRIIRICVVASLDGLPATNLQKQKVDALVEELRRRFEIPYESVTYPKNW